MWAWCQHQANGVSADIQLVTYNGWTEYSLSTYEFTDTAGHMSGHYRLIDASLKARILTLIRASGGIYDSQNFEQL